MPPAGLRQAEQTLPPVFAALDLSATLHMANRHGRVFSRASDADAYEPFFAHLRQIGYDQRISVEASTKDLPTGAPVAVGLLRRPFEP